jgi:hypothetical protein
MDELESIKSLLNKDSERLIPTLDESVRVVSHPDRSHPPPLNLDAIFEQALPTPPTLTASPASTAPVTEPGNCEAPAGVVALSVTEPEPATSYTRTAPGKRQPASDFSLELLIQEIVDDAIPMIEAQLREQLSQCAPDIIRQLAEKKSHR